jgi:hypothetical protein
VVLRKQRYAYTKIPSTPYTLGITVPDSHRYKFHGQIEMRRDGLGKNVTQFFEAPGELRQWKVNPDWTYCEYIRGEHPEFKDKTKKEDLVLHFLREIQKAQTSWAWKNTGVGIHTAKPPGMGSDIYSCKRTQYITKRPHHNQTIYYYYYYTVHHSKELCLAVASI